MALLDSNQIQSYLSTLPEWEIKGSELVRTFSLPSFAHALLLAGAVGQLAEAAGHHPDLRIYGYNKLEVRLTTHSAGGLTEKDFALAAQVQALPLRKPKA
jgi:4a-hydroxytetrahydrobiopterin dehydratase